jgi:hypothetical protein
VRIGENLFEALEKQWFQLQMNSKYIDHTDHFFEDSIFNLIFVVHYGHDTAYHRSTMEKICVDSTDNSDNF